MERIKILETANRINNTRLVPSRWNTLILYSSGRNVGEYCEPFDRSSQLLFAGVSFDCGCSFQQILGRMLAQANVNVARILLSTFTACLRFLASNSPDPYLFRLATETPPCTTNAGAPVKKVTELSIMFRQLCIVTACNLYARHALKLLKTFSYPSFVSTFYRVDRTSPGEY